MFLETSTALWLGTALALTWLGIIGVLIFIWGRMTSTRRRRHPPYYTWR